MHKETDVTRKHWQRLNRLEKRINPNRLIVNPRMTGDFLAFRTP